MKVLKWLDFGIFPGKILFSVGRDYDELMEELKRKPKGETWWRAGIENEKAHFDSGDWHACGRSVYNSHTDITRYLYYIILVRPFGFGDDDFCKLAHECLHICQFFLPGRLNRDKEQEAECYLHTHLMMQCIEAMRGEQKRIEKTNAKNVRA